MRVNVYTINAFAKTEDGGNPAGVVFDADHLSESQMKEIAKIVGFSETAFVMKSSVANYRIRFFTPTDEVDLCGHATIATFSLMIQKGFIMPGDYTQETKAGVLTINVSKDGTVMMEQTTPHFLEVVDSDSIARSLHISVNDFDQAFSPQIVSTGIKDIMVPICNRQVLDAIQPDMEKIAEVSRDYNVVGYHLFALDTLYEDSAYCRNFAPLYGIPEESATGTSNGALACYLAKYMKLGQDDVKRFVFEQGYSMGKPSEIEASLDMQDDQIRRVQVGGVARNIKERTVQLTNE